MMRTTTTLLAGAAATLTLATGGAATDTTPGAAAAAPAVTSSPAPRLGASPAAAAATDLVGQAVTDPAGADCGVDLGAPAVTGTIAALPPALPGTEVAWAEAADDGTYDPCRTLSAATVTVAGATGSSPEQVMLFHDGTFVDTATVQAYGFTEIDTAASTEDTVVVTYRYPGPGEANAEASVVGTVRYQWADGAVQQLDPLPAELTG